MGVIRLAEARWHDLQEKHTTSRRLSQEALDPYGRGRAEPLVSSQCVRILFCAQYRDNLPEHLQGYILIRFLLSNQDRTPLPMVLDKAGRRGQPIPRAWRTDRSAHSPLLDS